MITEDYPYYPEHPIDVEDNIRKSIHQHLKKHRVIVLRDINNSYDFTKEEFIQLFPGIKVMLMEDWSLLHTSKDYTVDGLCQSIVDNSIKEEVIRELEKIIKTLDKNMDVFEFCKDLPEVLSKKIFACK